MPYQASRAEVVPMELMQRLASGDELRYCLFLEATPASLQLIDLTGRLLLVSNRWLEILGFERHEVLGRQWSGFLNVIESHRGDMRWVYKLERALDGGHFALYWQLISPLGEASAKVHVEVLLRMIDDDDSLIAPGVFLSAAERFDLATKIDRWVIREMFTWMAVNRHELGQVETIPINLSGLSIGDCDFHQSVLGLMQTATFDRRKFCFEITETAAIMRIHEVVPFFEALRTFGVRFALDDFGSGFRRLTT